MSLRVGLVCPYSWDVPGGVRSHVADLAVTLRGRGHSVNVLAPVEEESVLPDWVTDGGRPVAVPYNGAVARLSFGVKATRRVRSWIREGDFDIVHIHEPLAPSLSVLTCWSARGPLVATWHSSHDRSRVLSAGYYVAQTAMEKLRGSIAVSEEARRTLIGHVGGDAVLIPNGVRVKDFTPESHDGHRSSDHTNVRISYSARLGTSHSRSGGSSRRAGADATDCPSCQVRRPTCRPWHGRPVARRLQQRV